MAQLLDVWKAPHNDDRPRDQRVGGNQAMSERR
jgi:hypothetical protein